MSHTLRSGFPPSHQNRPGRHSFDLSPKAVNVWLKSLPVGFPEASVEKLLDRVHKINRLSVPDQQRLSFLLSLGQQAHPLIQTLHNKLRDVAAPPRRKEMELAELVILLHSELALGYRNAIDRQTGDMPSRKHPPVTQGTLFNQALHHLYWNLMVHDLINVEPGHEIWEKIYALYALAEDQGILTEASSPFPGRIAETVEDTFKTILLVSLSAPQSLRGVELAVLWGLLPYLAPYAGLLSGQEATNLESGFFIELYSSQAPKRYAGEQHHRGSRASEYLALDIAPLVSEINRRLKALRHHKQAGNSRLCSNRHILKYLKSRLSPQRLHRSRRITGEFAVNVIAGFREVHYFLSGEKTVVGPNDASANGGKSESRRPHPLTDYSVNLNLELVNIEPQPYYKDDEATAPFASEKLDARQAHCRTLNFSTGGYCLATDHTKDFHLKVGELVAVHEGDENRWLPGGVTWVISDGHQLRFGVNLLAPFCRPGKVLCSRNQKTKSAECLLLLDDKQAQPSKILLSPSGIPAETTISVEFGGNRLDMALHKKLAKTPGYIKFQCEGIGPGENDE